MSSRKYAILLAVCGVPMLACGVLLKLGVLPQFAFAWWSILVVAVLVIVLLPTYMSRTKH